MTIFDQVLASTRFTALPTDYTDRYTPEVARQQGERIGTATGINLALTLLGDIKKPSKQLLDIITRLEEAADE